ncbi:MAG: sulfatase-like hydrolase/transferase [Planctomycetota bacterium]|jgi:choline-sulfatase|nr:sulfatase-like hydrolase/transferase [Planctomycetota bacterium]
MSDQPNILLLMTDQQRGDALGIEGHPVLQTPHLDWIGASGVWFRRAYSACPVCIPARRTLMSGQRPSNHGVLMNHGCPLEGPTLPGELAAAGYHTHLCGKLHLSPRRALYGFHSADWADSPAARGDNDYQRFLRREGVRIPRGSEAHGIGSNAWPVRPWHLPEEYHFSNWCVSSAIDFLERRDPTRPFFLKVSFLHPHQPNTPPAPYYERYLSMDLPVPHVGEWARVFDGPQRGLYPHNTWRIDVDPQVMHQMRAAYYASVNHIDDQIGRLLLALPADTIIVFCSDHGEMLGDHQWLRKRNAFEASARIPMLMKFPDSMGIQQERAADIPIEIMDLMPTFLDAAGAAIPDTVDGSSVLPWLRGESDNWREYLHGECASVPSLDSGMQYVTDGRQKYIWYPGTGNEHYFDLVNDPKEMTNLAEDPARQEEISGWRSRLISELEGRQEGFVDGGSLCPIGGDSPACIL